MKWVLWVLLAAFALVAAFFALRAKTRVFDVVALWLKAKERDLRAALEGVREQDAALRAKYAETWTLARAHEGVARIHEARRLALEESRDDAWRNLRTDLSDADRARLFNARRRARSRVP